MLIVMSFLAKLSIKGRCTHKLWVYDDKHFIVIFAHNREILINDKSLLVYSHGANSFAARARNVNKRVNRTSF